MLTENKGPVEKPVEEEGPEMKTLSESWVIEDSYVLIGEIKKSDEVYMFQTKVEL